MPVRPEHLDRQAHLERCLQQVPTTGDFLVQEWVLVVAEYVKTWFTRRSIKLDSLSVRQVQHCQVRLNHV